jgi:hypothetical protein
LGNVDHKQRQTAPLAHFEYTICALLPRRSAAAMRALMTVLDEADAIIDRFIAADSSAAAFVAVIKMLLGKIRVAAEALVPDMQELEERRAKDERDRAQDAARKRRKRASGGCPADAEMSGGCPADAVSSRAHSSSSYLEESKIGGDGECARERARDPHKNKFVLKEIEAPAADDPEEVAAEVERAVKDSGIGLWPEKPTEGWMRSTVVPQIAARLKSAARLPPGVARQVLIEAVGVAAKSHPIGGRISSFAFFNKLDGPIERALARALADHAAAAAQLALPLPPRLKAVKGASNDLDAHYKARLAAATEAERRANVGDAPTDGKGGAERSA